MCVCVHVCVCVLFTTLCKLCFLVVCLRTINLYMGICISMLFSKLWSAWTLKVLYKVPIIIFLHHLLECIAENWQDVLYCPISTFCVLWTFRTLVVIFVSGLGFFVCFLQTKLLTWSWNPRSKCTLMTPDHPAWAVARTQAQNYTISKLM